jgi:chemotaxis signal transduction protein
MIKQLSLDEAQKYCVFECQDIWYGLPSLSIRSVVPRPPRMPLPQCDPVIVGISHVQNEFVPVVSLRSLLDGKYEANRDEQLLMIMAVPQSVWGVLIDRAIGLTTLETCVSPFSDRFDTWSRISVGSATYGNRVVQVLDPELIYSYTANLLERYWSDASRFAGQAT